MEADSKEDFLEEVDLDFRIHFLFSIACLVIKVVAEEVEVEVVSFIFDFDKLYLI